MKKKKGNKKELLQIIILILNLVLAILQLVKEIIKK